MPHLVHILQWNPTAKVHLVFHSITNQQLMLPSELRREIPLIHDSPRIRDSTICAIFGPSPTFLRSTNGGIFCGKVPFLPFFPLIFPNQSHQHSLGLLPPELPWGIPEPDGLVLSPEGTDEKRRVFSLLHILQESPLIF